MEEKIAPDARTLEPGKLESLRLVSTAGSLVPPHTPLPCEAVSYSGVILACERGTAKGNTAYN